MSTDLELDRRMRAGLRELVDAVPIHLPAYSVSAPARGQRFAPVLALAAVAMVIIGIGFAPSLLPLSTPQAPSSTGSASLPELFAPGSALTGDLDRSPVGRAIAVYEQRGATVLGADANRYRHAGALDDKGPLSGTDVAGYAYRRWLLSPDGRRLASVSGHPSDSKISITDMGTGHTSRHQVAEGGDGVRLLAWSPDGRELAYVVARQRQVEPSGTLTLLDADSGLTRVLSGWDDIAEAAYSPDGQTIAVQPFGAAYAQLIDRQGGAIRRVPLPEGSRIVGPAAWSPDGTMLALTVFNPVGAAQRLAVIDVTSTTGQPKVGWGDHIFPDAPMSFLGWWSNATVLGISANITGSVTINQYPLGREGRVLATIDPPIRDLQLAWGLLPGMRVTADQPIDRGPWPREIYRLVAGLVGVPVLLVLGVWWYRRRRPRPPHDPTGGMPNLPPVMPLQGSPGPTF